MTIDSGQVIPYETVDYKLSSKINDFSEQESDFWSSIKRNQREFAHSLIKYPAMMVPAVQKKVIDLVLEVRPEISAMTDPYVGAGTSITTAMSCGLNCFGQDINPLAILVSRAKTDLSWSDNDLHTALTQTITTVKTDKSEEISISFPNMSKWFSAKISISLSKLHRSIKTIEDIRIRRIFWSILAETVRLTSNDRTTTYKLHVRPVEEIKQREISPINIFSKLANESIADLINYKNSLLCDGYIHSNKYNGHVKINLGNSLETELTPKSIGVNKFDLLVTSPPYGDNTTTITYGQYSYLPLRWIDLSDIDPMADENYIRTTQEIDRRSLGGHISTKLEDYLDEVREQSNNLGNIFDRFSSTGQPVDRTARVASFYRDFIKALDLILGSMADNAYLVWTIGNRRVGGIEIPNDKILIELLSKRNCVLVNDINRTIYFKRMPYKNNISKTMGSEEILVFRKQPDREKNQ